MGNVKDVLNELIAQYEAAAIDTPPNKVALGKWCGNKSSSGDSIDCLKFALSDEFIKPQSVVQKVWEVTQGGAFITSDCGPAPNVGCPVLRV